MESKILGFCFLLFRFMEVVPVCHQDPYPNLCDGNKVSTKNLAPTEIKCACDVEIFCNVINFDKECNPTEVWLGINESTTLLTQLSCNISPLESQAPIVTLEVLNSTESELSVRFPANSAEGMHKVFCVAPEISDEVNMTSGSEWEIMDVNPAEISVDSEIKVFAFDSKMTAIPEQEQHEKLLSFAVFQEFLLLTVNKAINRTIKSTPAWCFVHTPDNDTEALPVTDISEDQITCRAFTPAIPGLFRISLNYELPPYTFEEGISIKVTGKHPVAEKAEYDLKFETVLIFFDANIKLRSDCSANFPKMYEEYFGTNFDCYTKGNVLEIKMGSRSKVMEEITINSDNKICREVDSHSEFCFSALPANLNISKPKVSDPIVSLYTADVCRGNKTQKYVNLNVLNLNRESAPFQNKIQQANGKTHRKNLIIWRRIRQFQRKLSAQLALQINITDFLHFYEKLSAFNVDSDASDNNFSSSATVSVHVQSSFANSPLLVEANVEFCNDNVKLFRYKWLVDGRNAPEEGRLITLSNLLPGKHIIKCIVVSYVSGEVLGQGWATAELLENTKEILIIPSEAVVGMSDVITLHAVTLHTASWTCRTTADESCFRGNQSKNICGLTSPTISLPAGSLPLGDYVWTVEGSRETNTAKVSVKPGDVTVSVETPTAFVNPSLGFILNGSIQGAKETCYARWSSVRQKGYSYLDLPDIEVKEIFADEVKIPLAIPPSTPALQANSMYLFKLQVFCPQSRTVRYTKVPVRTSVPHTVSPVTVEPLSGEAMITNFRVSGAEAEASFQDSPLVFEWSYIDPCDNEVPLGRGLSGKNFTTYLPPGDVKVMARVCDGRKICSTSVSPTVAVIQPEEIHTENYEKTLSQIQYLMASGDVGEAFGLAVTVFKSLALTAEFEIRNKAFSVVEDAIALRIKHLTETLRSDPNTMKLSLEFSERAGMVEKYFRKGSAILMRLMDFRNSFGNFSRPN